MVIIKQWLLHTFTHSFQTSKMNDSIKSRKDIFRNLDTFTLQRCYKLLLSKSTKQVKKWKRIKIDYYFIACFTLSKKKPFPVHPYHEYQPVEEKKLIVLNLMYLKDFQKFSVGSRLCRVSIHNVTLTSRCTSKYLIHSFEITMSEGKCDILHNWHQTSHLF